MSIVIAYVDKEKALIVSDGRAGNVNENYNKTRVINEKIIIGFAGFAEQVELVLNELLNKTDEEIKDLDIETFSNSFYELFKTKPDSFIFESNFIISGINNNNEIVMYSIGAKTDFLLVKEIPNQTTITVLNSDIVQPYIHNIFTKHYNNNGITLLQRFIDCIREVSQIDPSVNNTTFHAEVHL